MSDTQEDEAILDCIAEICLGQMLGNPYHHDCANDEIAARCFWMARAWIKVRREHINELRKETTDA